jgi:hypothetical protein
MGLILLHRLTRLLLVAAYAAATVIAATSPLAACPTLDHGADTEHSHPAGHTDHHHDHGSGSHHGNCLNCCMGTCLLSVSLAPSGTSVTSLAFDGTVVVYVCEQSVMADRFISPDPDPPKPSA